MSKPQPNRKNSNKYGHRWLFMMIGPVLLVVAGLVLLEFFRQGQLERVPWGIVGMALGGIGALSASLVTLVVAFKEESPVDDR